MFSPLATKLFSSVQVLVAASGLPHLNRWEKNPPPLNFLKNKEVERGAEGERWTVRGGGALPSFKIENFIDIKKFDVASRL
jgi:hypothetical protein